MGHAQSGETNRIGKKYFSLCSHLKFKYFNFCEIFLQRNQSDSFLESRGRFTRIKKFLQNGRPTALSGLREDRSQYVLKTRNIELQTEVQHIHTYIHTCSLYHCYAFIDRLKWLPANLYAVGPAGYQIRGVLMDASWAYDLLCCLTWCCEAHFMVGPCRL